MPVRNTSLMALEQIQDKLEPDQWAVFEILDEIGPASDRRILEALNQKEQMTLKPKRFKKRWEINQVTARRNELVKLQLVRYIGIYKGQFHGKNKTYYFWAVRGDEREPIGWERLPDKLLAVVIPDKCANCRYRRNFIQQQAGRLIVEKLNVSQAGRILAQHRQSRKRQPIETALLFGWKLWVNP